MSEFLTTTEMINKLKVGEIAKAVKGFGRDVVTKNPEGNIVFAENSSMSGDLVQLYSDFLTAEWEIKQNYISFEEAIECSSEGKTIASWLDDDVKPYNIHYPKSDQLHTTTLHKFELIGSEIDRFSELKWTII